MTTAAPPSPADCIEFTHSAHRLPAFAFFPTLFYEAVTFVRNEAEYAAHPAAVDAGVLRHDAGDRAH